MGTVVLGQHFRCAAVYHPASFSSAFRSHIYDVICSGNDIRMVFNDQYRVAFVCQPVQNSQQYFYVFKMQTCCGFIQDVQGVARRSTGQFRGQFDTLAFPAAQCGSRLPQFDIPQSNVLQGFDFLMMEGTFLKIHSFVYRHIQHLMDVFVFVPNGQGIAFVALALTFRAGDMHVRQEIHFYDLHAGSFAGLASAPRTLKENEKL